MEGSKPLLVTATAIGLPSKPTPKGHFRVTKKSQTSVPAAMGSGSKGTRSSRERARRPPGSGYRYVGFPMQYWVEWMPAYGFHVGSVWPVPRTHGCLRLHQKRRARIFPTRPHWHSGPYCANATRGRHSRQNPPRPQDYNDPDPPNALPDFLTSLQGRPDPTPERTTLSAPTTSRQFPLASICARPTSCHACRKRSKATTAAVSWSAFAAREGCFNRAER